MTDQMPDWEREDPDGPDADLARSDYDEDFGRESISADEDDWPDQPDEYRGSRDRDSAF